MLSSDAKPCIEADISDLDSIVRIHVSSLPDDVFSNLGVRFLNEFYRNTLSHDARTLLIVKENGLTIGFCLVSYMPQSLLELVSFNFFLQALRLLLTRPRIFISGLLQSLRIGRVEFSQSAEISFIAVDPDYQGKGKGRLLVSCAIDCVRGQGMRYLNTKTSNRRLARFYKDQFNAREVYSFNVFDMKYSVFEWEI